MTNPAAPPAWDGYRETLDSLLEGFQIIDSEWRYVYVNPAAAEHGRRTREELVGRTMQEAYPGIEHTPLFAALERCMRERSAASFENLFTFPDRRARWFEIRVEPVPQGLCIHSVDIQPRKDAEAALRDQESVAALGRMAALVAHEVKNPLAGLAGALQVLKARRDVEHRDAALFEEMLRTIGSLTRLLQDLLVLARPLEVRPAPARSSEVIRDALRLVADSTEGRPHTFDMRVEEPEPVVLGDAELLKNVIRNLLMNAAQAMPQPGAITISATRDGDVCRIRVDDTGPGVPEHIAARLFEPFVSGRRGGTGLGLSISRRIARLHGGDLVLASSSASGTAFEITVPVAAAFAAS